MKLHVFTLFSCVGLAACAHDSRPQTVTTPAPAPASTLPYPASTLPYAEEPRLTPASGVATPRTSPTQPDAQQTDPNDSGIDQGDSEADLAVTRDIRRSIVADNTLSFTAKNVTIITRDGRVTLRGMVNTTEERASIEKAARRIGAVKQVENQLLVSMD